MVRRKVAVVQPILVPGGGTEAVTAWTIHSLQEDLQVNLITFSKVDLDTLDRFYGTQLDEVACSVVRPSLPPPLALTNRFAALKDHLMMRYCKSVQKDYDLLISIGGGVDFGRPSIQYFGLAPDSNLIKVLSNGHRLPGWYSLLKKSIMRGCEFLSGYSHQRMLRNTTLVTSKWAEEAIKGVYAFSDCQVVYPPVSGPQTGTPWDEREEVFLCVSRAVPEKRIDQAIEVLKRVRNQGFQISLVIVGRRDDGAYSRRIAQLAQGNPWITMREVMPREELQGIMSRSKYGINAAPDEPFGIAVAEMVKAGCIVFVPNGGGQKEIVDTTELVYDDAADAVDKITRVLNDHELQRALLHRMADQGRIFSTEAFCQNIRAIVRDFFED